MTDDVLVRSWLWRHYNGLPPLEREPGDEIYLSPKPSTRRRTPPPVVSVDRLAAETMPPSVPFNSAEFNIPPDNVNDDDPDV
jgi:hypothetical protein